MNKLNVTREGRPGIYLVEKSDIIDFIRKSEQIYIHNFRDNRNWLIVWADHEKESVILDIEEATRVAIMFPWNMGHKLAVILRNYLECYDLEITEDNINIIE